MQQLLEFIPIVLFFFAYFSKSTLSFGEFQFALGDIYSATAILMLATLLQLIISKLLFKTIEKRNWITSLIIFAFGGLTLILHNQLFIQWKPTIANWAFALALMIGPFFTEGQPLVKKLLKSHLEMPDQIWNKLTRFLILWFIFWGALNLVVVYMFSEASWVKFKLYSTIFSSILSTVIILYIIYPYLNKEQLSKPSNLEKDET